MQRAGISQPARLGFWEVALLPSRSPWGYPHVSSGCPGLGLRRAFLAWVSAAERTRVPALRGAANCAFVQGVAELRDVQSCIAVQEEVPCWLATTLRRLDPLWRIVCFASGGRYCFVGEEGEDRQLAFDMGGPWRGVGGSLKPEARLVSNLASLLVPLASGECRHFAHV